MSAHFEVSSPHTPENAGAHRFAALRMDDSESPPCTPTNAAGTRLLNCDAPPRRTRAFDVFARSELERAPKVARALFQDSDDEADEDEGGSNFARSPVTPSTAGAAERGLPSSATPPPSAAALRASQQRVGVHERDGAALDFYQPDVRDGEAAARASLAQYSPAVVRKLAFDAVADDDEAEDLSSTPPKQAQPMPVRRIVVVSPSKKGLPPPPPTPTASSATSAPAATTFGAYPAVGSVGAGGLPQARLFPQQPQQQQQQQQQQQSQVLQQTPIAVRPATTVMLSGSVSPYALQRQQPQQQQQQQQLLQPMLVSPGSLIITPEAQQAQAFYSNRETPSPVTMVASQLRTLRLSKATPPALPGRKVL